MAQAAASNPSFILCIMETYSEEIYKGKFESSVRKKGVTISECTVTYSNGITISLQKVLVGYTNIKRYILLDETHHFDPILEFSNIKPNDPTNEMSTGGVIDLRERSLRIGKLFEEEWEEDKENEKEYTVGDEWMEVTDDEEEPEEESDGRFSSPDEEVGSPDDGVDTSLTEDD
ncbi:hypothetical protein Anas_05250 [Armadillidium nasatum]|uniref:Uncharacterized protein n=1 Tax=Armadillidium nasatum TaxID=96803 RepID=A0A5N5T2T3_9CRUS|nr:hypothetical protein Anas_05250 [Armadillidium nasatum]